MQTYSLENSHQRHTKSFISKTILKKAQKIINEANSWGSKASKLSTAFSPTLASTMATNKQTLNLISIKEQQLSETHFEIIKKTKIFQIEDSFFLDQFFPTNLLIDVTKKSRNCSNNSTVEFFKMGKSIRLSGICSKKNSPLIRNNVPIYFNKQIHEKQNQSFTAKNNQCDSFKMSVITRRSVNGKLRELEHMIENSKMGDRCKRLSISKIAKIENILDHHFQNTSISKKRTKPSSEYDLN